MKRVISYHTSTVPGHSTARKATLQHLFHNRLLFSVQPDRHNEGRGNADGVDLYSLYVKQYGLDDEDESAAFIPLCSDKKEMPMLLQITRWHDHVWRYLKNDGEDSDEDSSEDSMDEEDERNGDDQKENDKKGSDDDNNNDNDNPYKYRQTRRHATEEDASEHESTQTGRKRRHQRSSVTPTRSSKRRLRELDVSDLGRDPEPLAGDSDSDSEEDTESEEAPSIERKRSWPSKRPSTLSDTIYSSGGRNLDGDDSDFLDFSEASDDDLDDSDNDGGEDSSDEGGERMGVGVRVRKRDL